MSLLLEGKERIFHILTAGQSSDSRIAVCTNTKNKIDGIRDRILDGGLLRETIKLSLQRVDTS